jgi:hypothetical protein
MERHYIPHNAAQFNAFVKNIIQYVEGKTAGAQAAWKNIPQERVAVLKDSHLLFEQALTATFGVPPREHPPPQGGAGGRRHTARVRQSVFALPAGHQPRPHRNGHSQPRHYPHRPRVE